MYSEILEPAKEEKNFNRLCLATAVLLLLGIPYIYELCLDMPPFIGEGMMLASYIVIIALSYRVYTRFVCGYRYSFVTERQMRTLPRGMGTILLKPGSVIIERMYGSKGNLAAIIFPEEVRGIILCTEKEFKNFKKKTYLLNRKLFTNRGRKKAYALMYERKGKKYYCLIAPSEELIDKIKGTETS